MTPTEEQQQIYVFVREGSGHGIIDAVAGAGKTTTIIESAAHVPPSSQALFCAFNKSISLEIEKRFQQKGMYRVTVRTIHALGLHLLTSDAAFGDRPQIKERKYHTLLNTAEIKEALEPHYRELLKINNLDPDNRFVKQDSYAARGFIYKVNERLLDINQKFRSTLCGEGLDDFLSMVMHFGIFDATEAKKQDFAKEVEAYYACHKILLQAGNELSKGSRIIDFTDMIYLPYHWNLEARNKYDFLFIDECQDLSKAQLAVAVKYAHREARVLAVGDPFQSIYGFAGADIRSFARIKERTQAKELPLTLCFRCPQQMITLARERRSDIRGNKEEPGVLQTIRADQVRELARANDLVICRFKAPLFIKVFEFVEHDIKVRIDHDEARELIRELKMLFKQPELNAVFATLPGGFEDLKLEAERRRKYIIQKEAQRITDSAERETYIRDEERYLRKRLAFLHKKSIKWADTCHSVDDILHLLMDYITAREDAIKLSTIHRAKGLEENRVFVLDFHELPYKRMDAKEWEFQQELNLRYVAVTRAKEELFLVQSVNVVERLEEGSLFDELFM